MISVLIVDDCVIIRKGIRLILESKEGFQIVGEASNGREALALDRELAPDVILLDWMMPHFNGLDVLQALKKNLSKAHIVMLSVNADEAYVNLAMQSGAAGYVLKDDTSTDLASAVRAVNSSGAYLSPSLARY